jgi:hypothetical protein
MSVCEALHERANSLQAFRFPFDEWSDSHKRNLHPFRERGDRARHEPFVRVGTHTGDKQLRSRLRQHFLVENKDRSIFRKNIGRALLHRDHDPFLPLWELDRTSRAVRDKHGGIDLDRQRAIERTVSDYIREYFSFVVVRVDEKLERLRLESRMVSTVSLCDACLPSAQWLGLSSPKEKIRESGLWLVNELHKEPLSVQDLERLSSGIATVSA